MIGNKSVRMHIHQVYSFFLCNFVREKSLQFCLDLRGSREGPKTNIQACIGCNYIVLCSSTEYPDQARTRAVNQNVYVTPECKIT